MNSEQQEKKPTLFQLKKQYKRLFLISFKNRIDIVFRLLTWGEVKVVQSIIQHSSISEDVLLDNIFDECVVHTNIENKDEIQAGIIYTVSNLILSNSIYTSIEDFQKSLEQGRNENSGLNAQIELLISKAFGYTKKEIDDMYFFEIMSQLAQSEKAIGGILPAVPIEISKPDKKGKKGKSNKQTRVISQNNKMVVEEEVETQYVG